MPVGSKQRHPNSLDEQNAMKVMYLRDVKELSWQDIVKPEQGVLNVSGERTTWKTASRAYESLKKGQEYAEEKYANCGRKADVFTKLVKRFLIQRLLHLRNKCVCTSTILQAELARAKGVHCSTSGIRKVLADAGYVWLKRRGERVYSPGKREKRVARCRKVLRLSDEELRSKLVLAVPPQEPIRRYNDCWTGDEFVYRQRVEGGDGSFGGKKAHVAQGKDGDVVPVWAGISDNGAAVVSTYLKRKFSTVEALAGSFGMALPQ